MKGNKQRSVLMLLAIIMLAAMTMMVGCSGSDGAAGATGSTGPAGPAGAAGPVTLTDESCAVCHSSGKIADVSDSVATGMHYMAQLPQATVTITGVVVSDPTGTPTFNTTFTVGNDSAYTGGLTANGGTNLSYLRFAYARLNGNSQWVRYSSGDRTTTHLVDNGNGTYTMSTPVALADYDATKPTRLLVLVSAVSGETAPLNVIYNFVPDGSTSTLSRDEVTENSCNACHANLDYPAGGISGIHGGARYMVAACVVCHAPRANSASGTQGISVGREMAYFIHAIHSEQNLKDTPDVIRGNDDWSEVTYPENIKNCQKCHTDVADADRYKNPSSLACSGCHTGNIVAIDGFSMTHDPSVATAPTGTKLDGSCMNCHDGSAAPTVATAHDTTPTGKDAPEYNVVISMSTPSNGSYFVTGETPVVTITLTNADGSAVPTGLTAAPGHIQGTFDANSLSTANLYVYGNRALPAPVMLYGKKSVNLMSSYYSQARHPDANGDYPVTGPTTNTDSHRTYTDTGYTYQLGPVTSGMKGTYFARTYIGNQFINFETGDYKLVSFAITKFQVNTATEDVRIAGDADGTSSCKKCHGVTLMHASDHAAPFDTDDCNSCHYDGARGTTLAASGDFISNRVHAVHSESVTGDLKNHDWSEIAYPQNVKRCVTCHGTTNTSYKTQQYLIPCYGCHADNDGAIDHMLQNGGKLK
jgi:hypothetical protein